MIRGTPLRRHRAVLGRWRAGHLLEGCMHFDTETVSIDTETVPEHIQRFAKARTSHLADTG